MLRPYTVSESSSQQSVQRSPAAARQSDLGPVRQHDDAVSRIVGDDLLQPFQIDDRRPMHPHKARRVEQPLERAERHAHDMDIAIDVQLGAVIGGLDPIDAWDTHDLHPLRHANGDAREIGWLGYRAYEIGQALRELLQLSLADDALGTVQRL